MKDIVNPSQIQEQSDRIQLLNDQIPENCEILKIKEASKIISKNKRRSKYLKIDDEMRKLIIFEVMVMNNPLRSVCQKHDINFSSAKNVVQIFKKEGRLEKKMQRSRKSKNKNESKNDPEYSSDDDLQKLDTADGSQRDQIYTKKQKLQPTCSVILSLNEDDTFGLKSMNPLSDIDLKWIKQILSQKVTQL
eukprot:403376929